eukprot:gene2020-1210_t
MILKALALGLHKMGDCPPELFGIFIIYYFLEERERYSPQINDTTNKQQLREKKDNNDTKGRQQST